jgi:hypothetical protein
MEIARLVFAERVDFARAFAAAAEFSRSRSAGAVADGTLRHFLDGHLFSSWVFMGGNHISDGMKVHEK